MGCHCFYKYVCVYIYIFFRVLEIVCHFYMNGKEFQILSRDQFWLEEEKT